AVIEPVLDTDQRGRDLDQRRLVGLQAPRDDLLELLGLRLDGAAQLAEAEHTEGVADLAQQLHLRAELLRLARPAAYEDVEDILHLGEILADRRRDGLHELDARRREALALLLDALIDRQQLREAERGSYGRDTHAAAFRAAHVIEKVVQQLDRRHLAIARLAELVEAADLAVREPEQPLDRLAALEAVLAQRLDDRAHHPPELEYRLPRGRLLELLRHRRQRLKVLLDALAANP